MLELNAKHPVFDKLKAAQESGDKEKLSLYAGLLYDQALLVEGTLPDDPVAFASHVCELYVVAAAATILPLTTRPVPPAPLAPRPGALLVPDGYDDRRKVIPITFQAPRRVRGHAEGGWSRTRRAPCLRGHRGEARQKS